MKVVDISFYFGIIVVILTFITMVCFVWEDIHRHKEKITQNIGKYGVFICMWLLLAFFCLIFVLSYGTNILSLMGETAIYDTKGKIGVAIFILWTVFIAVKYYLYILFSEFTSDNKNDVIKIQRQIIFLSVMTILVEVYFIYKYINVFVFWVSV
ncbi:hypothetical protein [Dialister invisus]|uniref:hypothetical protein n=1 Tax=Dialister invisus TaxID=218538 RepID=UPI0028D4CB2D|nr:hypothetical protein [Dialister invisus]